MILKKKANSQGIPVKDSFKSTYDKMYFTRYCAHGGTSVTNTRNTEARIQIGGMTGSMSRRDATTRFIPDLKIDEHPYSKEVKTGK